MITFTFAFVGTRLQEEWKNRLKLNPSDWTGWLKERGLTLTKENYRDIDDDGEYLCRLEFETEEEKLKFIMEWL